ncbi:MAG TPA: hypothetical protein P5125_03120 [Kiritimatiellia bacterium]|nr:hypothetical protein [Kiritimatiellia bacterium]
MDHAELEARLPEGVQVSFDGLRITVDETAAARPLPVRERSAG